MLVLSRRSGERVFVGGDVEIVVLEIRGDRVKLGFRGPGRIPIYRSEVCERKPGCFPALEEAECA
ncbi:MAG: carbon storage regulator [Thermoguttaceae bacterium]